MYKFLFFAFDLDDTAFGVTSVVPVFLEVESEKS